MSRLTRKICIIGDFAVGKTSTVERFVNNVFSDKYLTTVGVKINTREMDLPDGRSLKLVIWDVAGSKRFSSVEFSYLRGAQAFLLVADGTREVTLDHALALREAIERKQGKPPFVLLLNKHDLDHDWQINDSRIEELRNDGMCVLCTSAKTGECVEQAFEKLAEALAAEA